MRCRNLVAGVAASHVMTSNVKSFSVISFSVISFSVISYSTVSCGISSSGPLRWRRCPRLFASVRGSLVASYAPFR